MRIDVTRFRTAFFEEAVEHLATIERGLIELERSGGDAELMNEIFRSVHSIKGASGSFGLNDIAEFTHGFESVLDRLRQGQMRPDRALTTLLLRAADILSGLVRAAQGGGAPPAGVGEVRTELESLLSGSGGAKGPVPVREDGGHRKEGSRFRISFRPGRDLFRSGMDPLLLLRDLENLGTISDVELDRSELPALALLDAEACYLAWQLTLVTDQTESAVREVFTFVEDACRLEIVALPDQAGPVDLPAQVERRTPAAESSIRVATEKVDELINLVGELVIAQAMVSEIIDGFSLKRLGDLRAAIAAMARNTQELQARVLSVRMLPVAMVFNRFPRLVRDLAEHCGRVVRLEVLGEDTELDKGVIEKLGDPILHLVRNAIDHGIEAPEERLARGKPAEGRLRLAAYHEGGNVVIEVTDDGRGLDPQKIRAKALERGLVKPDETLTDDQLHALIMAPGFSTATAVTDVSGRGVGLDVVRQNVESLNGSVGIESRSGEGSTMRIRLPLTLAIVDGLALRVGGQTFIVPLLAIRESFRPRPADLKSVFGQGEIVLVRGEPLPLVRLHRQFGIGEAVTDPASGLVLVLSSEGTSVGILVDELLGQSQFVVKSLEQQYRRVDGVMGATILGDGRVALILDAPELARLALLREPERDALCVSGERA
ncbi:MAG: chemotaxis protein CheA [Candidatus Eisenbacteria bacterium]|nr:chemotaxis protein CheA [Candidatus Eisenbacteria bacterium]